MEFESEKEVIKRMEMNFIPSTIEEIRSNKFYVLPSMLRQFQAFPPQTKPINDKSIKGNAFTCYFDIKGNIFTYERMFQLYIRRTDGKGECIELSYCRRLEKQVKSEEKPIKTIKGFCNDPDQVSELFGEWQIVELKNTLIDGHIPSVSPLLN